MAQFNSIKDRISLNWGGEEYSQVTLRKRNSELEKKVRYIKDLTQGKEER